MWVKCGTFSCVLSLHSPLLCPCWTIKIMGYSTFDKDIKFYGVINCLWLQVEKWFANFPRIRPFPSWTFAPFLAFKVAGLWKPCFVFAGTMWIEGIRAKNLLIISNAGFYNFVLLLQWFFQVDLGYLWFSMFLLHHIIKFLLLK